MAMEALPRVLRGLPVVPEHLPAAPALAASACAPTPDALASATSAPWVRGGNTPHISRRHIDGSGVVSEAVQEILGNLNARLDVRVTRGKIESFLSLLPRRRSVCKISALLQFLLEVEVAPHITLVDAVVAHLVGMKARTVANTTSEMRRAGWCTLERSGCVGRPSRVAAAPPPVDGEAVPESSAELLRDLAVEESEDDAPNPEPARGSAPATADSSSAAQAPSWAQDGRSIGLRLGSLAARVYVDPHLPMSAFTGLASWIDEHAPGMVGTTNHGSDFPVIFGRVMGVHLQTCLALTHWQLLPALQIPSDYQRVIDGYTCMGEPLLVLVHVLTLPDGTLTYMNVDMSPNAANALQAGRSAAVAASKPCHRWKSGAAVAEHIALLESGLAVSLSEACARHAGTAADGAFIGPHGNQVVQHYSNLILRDMAGALPEPLASAIRDGRAAWEIACEFHAIQVSGALADARFSQKFDEMLRWLHQRFAFGSGRVIARGVARILDVKWRVPLAPRADGFKATAYSRLCGQRFHYLLPVMHAALEIELEAVYTIARTAAKEQYEKKLTAASAATRQKRTKEPDYQQVGLRVQQAFAIRQVGRTMLSPYELVFGLGRYELRDRFLGSYSVLTQKFTVSALVKVAEQRRMILSMREAIHAILNVVGDLRVLQAGGWDGTGRARRRIPFKVLALHVRVVCSRLWRHAPMLTRALPDMLAPRDTQLPNICKVPLVNFRFDDPPLKRKDPRSYEQKRAAYIAEREQRSLLGRWGNVIQALADLARWLRLESIFFPASGHVLGLCSGRPGWLAIQISCRRRASVRPGRCGRHVAG